MSPRPKNPKPKLCTHPPEKLEEVEGVVWKFQCSGCGLRFLRAPVPTRRSKTARKARSRR